MPKKSKAKELPDYRSVALTSTLCKCMERVVVEHLSDIVAEKLEPLQFACRAKHGVEDACLTLLDTVCKHLNSPHPNTRILFMDFSSAFNTVDPLILCNCLRDAS